MNEIDINNIERDYLKAKYPSADFDKVYTFYYDETNNLRKFYVRESDFNTAFCSNFILGGLVFEKNEPDLSRLFAGLKLQKTAKELKFKHIANGDFITCLKSAKLNYFFQYLFDNEISIHFSWVNILYWSITDIVDSAIANSEAAMKVASFMGNKVKSDFYKFAKIEMDTVIKLFYKYQYPNIKKESIVDFIDELISLFYDYIYTEEFHFGLESLRQILKEARRNQSLPFLTNEEDYTIVKDFSSFYLNPICLFRNSKHIFDKEDSILEIIEKTKITDGNVRLNNYSFVESESNLVIQASDVVVGILGKFSTFINTSSYDEIKSEFDSLSIIQKKNIDLLIDLMDRSAENNSAFITSVDSQEELDKVALIREMRNKL